MGITRPVLKLRRELRILAVFPVNYESMHLAKTTIVYSALSIFLLNAPVALGMSPSAAVKQADIGYTADLLTGNPNACGLATSRRQKVMTLNGQAAWIVNNYALLKNKPKPVVRALALQAVPNCKTSLAPFYLFLSKEALLAGKTMRQVLVGDLAKIQNATVQIHGNVAQVKLNAQTSDRLVLVHGHWLFDGTTHAA